MTDCCQLQALAPAFWARGDGLTIHAQAISPGGTLFAP